jgi:hypothetical protein
MHGTRTYVDSIVRSTKIDPDLRFFLGEAAAGEEVSDLAD